VEALELCASADPLGLPRRYRAEYYFTRAAALLATGRLDDAETALELGGAELARRVSSKRNVLFLRARLAAVRGN
jgi:hypothetical protein